MPKRIRFGFEALNLRHERENVEILQCYFYNQSVNTSVPWLWYFQALKLESKICAIAILSQPENWYASLKIGCSNQNSKGVQINWTQLRVERGIEFECDPLVRVVHGLLRKRPLLMNSVTVDRSCCGDEFQCFFL